MIKIDFLNVIRTGTFGPVQLNNTKEEVIGILGPPDGFSNSDIYDGILYDRFEFSFKENRLQQIYYGYIQNWYSSWRFNRMFHLKNEMFEITSWFKIPYIDTRLEEIIKKLNSEGISYTQAFYHDSIKVSIGSVNLLFSSPLIWHQEESSWSSRPLESLELKLTHFYLWQPIL
jgi:hypothetical protein